MKVNLKKEYSSIEKRDKNDFLANRIVLDTHWGQPIWGVAFQIDLGKKVGRQLKQYQAELNWLEPGNFLFPDSSYWHITVNQVVHWCDTYQLGLEGTWKNVKPEFLEKFRKLDKTFQSFDLTFSKLIATHSGIIWCAYDKKGEMRQLRNFLYEKLPIPPENSESIKIIHTTVARYKNRLNNPKRIVEFIEKNQQPVVMKVNKIYLRNELIFPSIKTKTLASINLM